MCDIIGDRKCMQPRYHAKEGVVTTEQQDALDDSRPYAEISHAGGIRYAIVLKHGPHRTPVYKDPWFVWGRAWAYRKARKELKCYIKRWDRSQSVQRVDL